MEEVLDSGLTPKPNDEVRIIYGKFWPRTGALLLDGLAVGIPLFIVAYLNTSWKSIPLLLLTSLIGIAYKPWMEYQYGATLGKMALGLKVVDLNYDRPHLGAVLLRNVFGLGSGVWSIIFSVIIFLSPEFQDVTGFMEYAALQNSRPERYVQWIFSLITLVEIIFLLTDDRCRTLHDRIGNTYVIEGK
jgi:uncharacterized RDD family membrane protein YckC